MPRIYYFNPFEDGEDLSFDEQLKRAFGFETTEQRMKEKAKRTIDSKITGTGTGYIIHPNMKVEDIKDYVKSLKEEERVTKKKGCWIKILNYRLKLDNISYEEILKKYVIVKSDGKNVSFLLADKCGNALFETDNGLPYNNSFLLVQFNLDLIDSDLEFLRKPSSIAIPVGGELLNGIDSFAIDENIVRAYTLEPHELYEQEPLAGVDYELYESLSERPEGFANDDPLYVLYQDDDFSWSIRVYRAVDVIQEMYDAGIVFAKEEYAQRMIEFLVDFLPMSKGDFE